MSNSCVVFVVVGGCVDLIIIARQFLGKKLNIRGYNQWFTSSAFSVTNQLCQGCTVAPSLLLGDRVLVGRLQHSGCEGVL